MSFARRQQCFPSVRTRRAQRLLDIFVQGKLFRVEIEPSGMVQPAKAPGRSEFFWLCDDCASHLTLEYDRQMGVVIVKRLDPELRAAS